MVFVACSGFPVPVSQYWKQFSAVEIADTEIGIPGEGSVRRWLRESPKGFGFTLLGPREIAQEGFEQNEKNAALLEALSKLSRRLRAHAVVFVAPGEYEPTRKRKSTLKSFLGSLPEDFPPIVLDFPEWSAKEALACAGDRTAAVAHDPLHDATPPQQQLAYVRLGGPAGYRSRYDETALDAVAEHCRQLTADSVFCVFRNMDMHANGRALLERLG
jgi:uncharacterized protein YecE (DUF72 family)